jgi:hypothetical protein
MNEKLTRLLSKFPWMENHLAPFIGEVLVGGKLAAKKPHLLWRHCSQDGKHIGTLLDYIEGPHREISAVGSGGLAELAIALDVGRLIGGGIKNCLHGCI